jgi:branched-chain amino acid transport system substrate-binding protein
MTRSLAMSLLRVVLVVVVSIGVLFWLVLKDNYYTPAAQMRGGVEWPPRSIKIAVPWPHDGRISINEGVTLGLEELNAGGGPLAGKIDVQFIDEPPDVSSAGAIARRIAADHDIVAVIGHESSSEAMTAAVTYEAHGILHLSPKATLPRLTRHQFKYTFTLLPDDHVFAKALVGFAHAQGWMRIGVLYGRTEESEELARLFSLQATAAGMTPTYFRSYLPAKDYRTRDFRELLASMRTTPTDAILLADRLPWAAKVLLDMQAVGITEPILSGDNLDSSDVWSLAKTAANNLYVASPVDPESSEPAFAAFRERFRKRFGSNPGYGSAQGYEAFTLFVKAVERSRSVAPIVLATTLKTNSWQGLFGNFSFLDNGQIVGRKIVIKRMQDGVFRTVNAE